MKRIIIPDVFFVFPTLAIDWEKKHTTLNLAWFNGCIQITVYKKNP